MVSTEAPPQWQTETPKKSGIDYLVALQYPNVIVYDILNWHEDPDGTCNWSPFYSKAAHIIGHIRLADCLRYLTGYETPVEHYTPIAGKLHWNFNEPISKEVQLAVIPGSYDLIEWDEDGWSYNIEHCFGHIPLKAFLQAVEKELPFNFES